MINLERVMAGSSHWADAIAERLIKSDPKAKKFTCAAGISPSGVVHIGNFRDVITSDSVVRALVDKGYDAELIFSWDEYDRLRKVPKGVPEEFSKHLWMPLVEIPDPDGCHSSYAKHFEVPFEETVPLLGIKPRFIHQAKEYHANNYYEGIKTALRKRKEIAKILAKFKTQGMTKGEMDRYYPLQVYCGECKRSDSTKITNYDEGDLVTYRCGCGNEETVDISKKNIGKLDWKVDWPMRWKHENVSFEPGGEDHASPGGSFDVAKEIAKKIYGINPPIFEGYGFVGVEGVTKMSSSKGSGLAPKDLLDIYEPELLKWLFTRAEPKKAITLFFDSQIIRQYDEFDSMVLKHNRGELDEKETRDLDLAKVDPKSKLIPQSISFRQVASFGQVSQGKITELKEIFDRMGQTYDSTRLPERLSKTQNWVERFAPDWKIKVLDSANKKYYSSLSEERRNEVGALASRMNGLWNLEGLTTLVYDIPKREGMSESEKKEAQRAFFKDMYNLLISADTGPRLPTFLLALGKKRVKSLLNL